MKSALKSPVKLALKLALKSSLNKIQNQLFKAKRTFASFLFPVTLISFFAMSFGCGGGGGSSGPATSPYVAVTSVSPALNATSVDARIESIKVNFSAALDPSSFLTQGAALGKLLSAKNIKLKDSKTGALVDPAGLSLAELVSGKYTIPIKVDGVDTIAIPEAYDWVLEATGAYGLRIRLLNQTQTIDFTSSELLNSGVVNSSLFKVQVGTDSKTVYGQITVKDSTLTFVPINFLNWSSNYTVTVSKAIKDATGRPLQDDYVWKFTTLAIPEPAVDKVSPIGIDANPIKVITAQTNFQLNTSSLTSGTIVLNKLVRLASDQTPQKTPVPITLSYNAGLANISITPNQDLEYLQEYEVTVKGVGGVTGSFGNQTGIRLNNDFAWTFTTAAPKLVSYSPAPASATSAVVERDAVLNVELNFRPNPATISQGLLLLDNLNNAIPFTTTISEGLVTIKPKNLLNYGTLYSVIVTPSLRSINNANVGLAAEKSFSFTTVQRKVISQTPFASSSGASSSASVFVGFNFDVNPAALTSTSSQNNSYLIVEQQVNSGAWTRLKGSVSYNSSTRTAEFFPSQDYLFNATIRVTVNASLPAIEGGTIFQSSQWTFTVRNQTLSIYRTNPTSYQDPVALNTEIYARMSYPIDPNSVDLRNAIKVRDCNYRDITGRISYDSDTVYFLPTQTLSSFCTHTVTLDSNIRGTLNEKQSGTNSWTFKTDGLKVSSLLVTYAYGDLVDIAQPIQVYFNYPVSYYSSSNIYLVDSRGYSVSATLYRYSDSIEVLPTYKLKYGEEYRLYVTRGVQGINGEQLAADVITTFYTENLPLDVLDYGPTGTVYVDDYFWVDLSQQVSSYGFPKYTDSGIYPYVNTYISNDSNYLLKMTPSSFLSYSTNYEISFKFKYSSNTTVDNFTFSWNVKTEAAPLVKAQSAGSALATANSVRNSPLALDSSNQKRVRGCRNDVTCLGSLRTTSVAEFKRALSGKRKANILPADIQARLKAQRARKNAM